MFDLESLLVLASCYSLDEFMPLGTTGKIENGKRDQNNNTAAGYISGWMIEWIVQLWWFEWEEINVV